MSDHPVDHVHEFLGRFVSYPSGHAHVAHTLWIAHTHLMRHWDSTPRLAFLSPEPGSGKSRALEVTALLVPRPVETVNATPAYLFRKVGDPGGLPTLLYDEIDTVFGPKARDNEDVRGMLNAGHRRGAVAGRCVMKGKAVETEELPAFCAVALAGLGNLPDTITTRSVIIPMRRRTPEETVEPFRDRIQRAEAAPIMAAVADWAELIENVDFPEMPNGIVDRDADIWESLIAVADLVGCDWPGRARSAATMLVAASKAKPATLGVRLLADIRTAFGTDAQIATVVLLEKLNGLEEAPWGDLRGKALNSRQLARMLSPYDVKSTKIRTGATTANGYRKADLLDAWQRYLPPSPEIEGTSGTSGTRSFYAGKDVPDVPDVPVTRGRAAGDPPAENCAGCNGCGCGWCEVSHGR